MYDDDYDIYSNFPREYTRERAERRTTESTENKKEFFLKTVAAQLIVCILLFGLLLIYKKTDSFAFQIITEKYKTLMQKDMSISEIAGAFKNVTAFAIEPQAEWKTDETTTQAESEITTESKNEYTADEEDIYENEDMGGEDLTLATANTTFSPVYLTEKMVAPVSGEITSVFGYRTNPITNVYGFHTGVDIDADTGTNVAAAFDGKVKETGKNNVRGNYIVLEHKNNIETIYYHCSEIVAETGAVIRQGETIAKVGSTGRSTGPHLHFEIKIDGVYCNPSFVLNV